MKKNKMMRTASGLLVATLLTTSIISGTFAKYTTTNSGSDSARVAKWGVVLQADGSLYGKNYGTGINSAPTTDTTVGNLSVAAAATAVAPGTQNDKGLNFSVNGTPEVRTKLTATIKGQNIYLGAGTYAVMVKAPDVTAASWKAATYYTKDNEGKYTVSNQFAESDEYYTKESEVELENPYYPVIYKADITNGNTSSDSLKAIVEDYAKKLGSVDSIDVTKEENNVYEYTVEKEYAPNTELESLNVNEENLTWAWAIAGQNDAADTILGDLQAGTLKDAEVVKVTDTEIKKPTEHTDYNLETSFSIEITVEQVD